MSYKSRFNCLLCISALLFMLFLQTAGAQDFSALDQLLEQRKAQWGGKLVAMVWKDDKVAFQKTTGDLTINSQEPVGYASAWFTAAVVMSFVDQGKLSLDDRVSKYLPIFGKYAKSYLTIRHCLANTTGLEPEKGGIQKFFQKTKFPTLEEEVNSFASGREIVNNPGEAFNYNNIGTNIAARVVEVIGKKTFDRLALERVFRPLGMKKTSFASENAVNAASGAVSTPADYLKFLAMLLNNGTLAGKKVISEASVAEMQKVQTNGAKIAFAPKATEGFGYGLGNWIQDPDDKGAGTIFSSPGLSGGWPYLDKKRKYACVVFVQFKGKEDKKETYLEIMNELQGIL